MFGSVTKAYKQTNKNLFLTAQLLIPINGFSPNHQFSVGLRCHLCWFAYLEAWRPLLKSNEKKISVVTSLCFLHTHKNTF